MRPPAGPPTSDEVAGFKEALSVCAGVSEFCREHPQRKKAFMNEHDVTKHLCELCILDPQYKDLALVPLPRLAHQIF